MQLSASEIEMVKDFIAFLDAGLPITEAKRRIRFYSKKNRNSLTKNAISIIDQLSERHRIMRHLMPKDSTKPVDNQK